MEPARSARSIEYRLNIGWIKNRLNRLIGWIGWISRSACAHKIIREEKKGKPISNRATISHERSNAIYYEYGVFASLRSNANPCSRSWFRYEWPLLVSACSWWISKNKKKRVSMNGCCCCSFLLICFCCVCDHRSITQTQNSRLNLIWVEFMDTYRPCMRKKGLIAWQKGADSADSADLADCRYSADIQPIQPIQPNSDSADIQPKFSRLAVITVKLVKQLHCTLLTERFGCDSVSENITLYKYNHYWNSLCSVIYPTEGCKSWRRLRAISDYFRI